MVPEEFDLIPSNIVMEEYIKPAMGYYEKIIDKISPYFFCDSLIKMVGFQQLIVSKAYQIKREDARSKKGIDYVRECVSQIQNPHDLINLMESWYAFDLCFTGPSFVNPIIASNIRKKYCLVGNSYFDCHNCKKIICKQNLIWDKSTIVLDFDAQGNSLEDDYFKIKNELDDLNLEYSIKLSSLSGLHVNIGLPKKGGTTIFDRNVYHYCVLKELLERGINLDDNSLDPVPIIRAPFSLHYKRLTPSLCVEGDNPSLAIDILKDIESFPLKDRIEKSLEVSKHWRYDWNVDNSSQDSFDEILMKWEKQAKISIFREKIIPIIKKTNVGDYLKKGKLMTEEDEQIALQILLKEGKSKELASKIIEINKKKGPKLKQKQEPLDEEILLEYQRDIPKKILEIPPPTLFLVIDNATIKEMQKITGTNPLKVKAQCINTTEGMTLLFKDSKLLKNYPRKWNCTSTYIGGLYSAYNFCSSADIVIAVKRKNVWDRDMKILNELGKILVESKDDFIVAHLLGLDFCKDHNLNTDGAILVFKKLIKSALSTNFNIVLSSDHSGEEFIPYFEVLTRSKQ